MKKRPNGLLEQQTFVAGMDRAYLNPFEPGKAAITKASNEVVGIYLCPPSEMPKARYRGRRVPVITIGEVFVRAAADVVESKKVLAMPDGGMTCPKRGRRRNGAIDVIGATWLTTTAKGELGKIVLRGGIRRLPQRRVVDED
jgi:hypothetical protein